jgi:hypothetical protein
MPSPSTVYPVPPSEQEIRPSTASKKDLISRYYLIPLKEMNGDQAFIAMSICFLLYEKYLRRTGKLKRGEHFSEGSKVFNQIGSDLDTSKHFAFLIWRDWRNGLLHAGMPFTRAGLEWELDGKTDKVVAQDGKKVILNPWLFRDKIVNKVASKKEIWVDLEAPLMMEYERLRK